MSEREVLVDLLLTSGVLVCVQDAEGLADYLLENGVDVNV